MQLTLFVVLRLVGGLFGQIFVHRIVDLGRRFGWFRLLALFFVNYKDRLDVCILVCILFCIIDWIFVLFFICGFWFIKVLDRPASDLINCFLFGCRIEVERCVLQRRAGLWEVEISSKVILKINSNNPTNRLTNEWWCLDPHIVQVMPFLRNCGTLILSSSSGLVTLWNSRQLFVQTLSEWPDMLQMLHCSLAGTNRHILSVCLPPQFVQVSNGQRWVAEWKGVKNGKYNSLCKVKW